MQIQKTKPGYKLEKSLFGKEIEIPKDWEIKKFDELFEFLRTGTNSRSDLEKNGDIQYIHYGDIHAKWNSILDCDSDEIPWIDKTKVERLPLLKDGDLIIVDASEDYEGSGASILLKNVKNKKIVSGLHTIALRSIDENILSDFKTYLTSINFVKNQIIAYVTGISVYGLSKKNLKKIKIPLPPFLEQQKIASVLSTIYELINKYNSTIESTEHQKQGLLQQLLIKGIGHKKFKKFNTLRIRSYNIPEKWSVVKFEKIAKFLGGYAFSSKDYTKKGIQLLRQGNLQNRELYLEKEPVFLDKSFVAEYAGYIVKSGEIVVSLTGTKTKRDYGYAVLIPENSQMLFLNQRMAKITPNKTVIPEFLTYSMNHRYFEDQFYRLEAGTKQANVSLQDVKKINIFVPSLEEQEKIVSILFEIDSRLSYLKTKKTSLASIQKGLMQKLLTGQI